MHVTSPSGRIFDLPSPEEEARIREGIAKDPDTHELTDEELAQMRPLGRSPGRPKANSTKQPVSIRLSPEVIEYFKAEGPGWQTRIDAVLREHVKTHQ
ncbi:BrnA antitoxin family protein [Thiorhodococcus fuscus]|uniref:BrnA antitoxin family protein n=1 Tax=Thiorhodococcus fuscus TaxID=527200 RepID=A0ABW4YCA0_9GAMM